MGYGGYLVKFGDYTIPNNLIKQDTFSSYVNMQDKDLGRTKTDMSIVMPWN